MKITIIDGQGGMLGAQLVKEITAEFPDAEITAIGTNAAATAADITMRWSFAPSITAPLGLPP